MEKTVFGLGSILSRELLDEIESLWCSRLNAERDIKSVKPEYFDYYKNDIFFYIHNDNNLAAAGRLRPIQVRFLGKDYLIHGVSDIASKEKGFGSKLMTAIMTYGAQNNATLIGFCKKELDDFYIKSGFKILPGAKRRFTYDKPGYLASDRDVLYFQGKPGFIDDLLSNPHEIVQIPVPHW